jgi:hypothetical protein
MLNMQQQPELQLQDAGEVEDVWEGVDDEGSGGGDEGSDDADGDAAGGAGAVAAPAAKRARYAE